MQATERDKFMLLENNRTGIPLLISNLAYSYN